MTSTEARTKRPETYTRGLGEEIRAHRLYVGLSQRDMADRLGKDRRDYQRIENGRDACPPGMLSQMEELSDRFAHQVDVLLDTVRLTRGAIIEVTPGGTPEQEWDRLVAGRAAVEASDDAPITLTIVGELNERSGG